MEGQKARRETDNEESMAFIADWFTFGFDPDFDDGVRAFERGEDMAAALAFRKSAAAAPDSCHRERAAGRLVSVLRRMGQQATHRGDLVTAREAFAEAMRLRPTYADLRIGASWACFVGHDFKGAFDHAQAAVAINAENGQARVLMGLALTGLGRAEEGFATVQENLKAWREAPGSILDALGLWSAGDKSGAANLAMAIKPPPPLAVDQQIATADAAMKDRKWDQAEAGYRAVLTMKPGYADVWAKLGQCHLNLDDYERAAVAFQEAISINERYAQAWSLLGVALRRSGEEEPALEAFRRALEIDPNEPVATHELTRRRV